MKHKTIYTAVLSLCLVAGSAMAQDRGNDDHRGGQQQGRNDNHDQNRGDNRGDNHDNRGRNDRNNYQSHDDRHDGARGAGPRHDMRRGQRIPNEYRNRQYVVDDWRGHHLSAPPRGQHWVQAGGDYVLVAIATGVIASVLLNN